MAQSVLGLDGYQVGITGGFAGKTPFVPEEGEVGLVRSLTRFIVRSLMRNIMR